MATLLFFVFVKAYVVNRLIEFKCYLLFADVGNMYSVYIKDLPYYADTYKHYLVLLLTFAEVTKYFFLIF